MKPERNTLQLAMASTPAIPIAEFAKPSPRFRTPGFKFTGLMQQGGLFLLIGLMSLACYFGISRYFLRSVKVVGVSMYPTLQENNQYLLNLWAFRKRAPQHNDIVVIRDPADHGLSVKRIIAVSGEAVLFKEGKVYVDGKPISEPYLLPGTLTFTYSQAKEQFITCGKDQYFVLGDNRLRSIDSRSYGPVPRSEVLGLVEVQ